MVIVNVLYDRPCFVTALIVIVRWSLVRTIARHCTTKANTIIYSSRPADNIYANVLAFIRTGIIHDTTTYMHHYENELNCIELWAA